MTEGVVIPLVDHTEGTVLEGHEHIVVQDPITEHRIIRYHGEHGLPPDGGGPVAPLFAEVVPSANSSPDRSVISSTNSIIVA